MVRGYLKGYQIAWFRALCAGARGRVRRFDKRSTVDGCDSLAFPAIGQIQSADRQAIWGDHGGATRDRPGKAAKFGITTLALLPWRWLLVPRLPRVYLRLLGRWRQAPEAIIHNVTFFNAYRSGFAGLNGWRCFLGEQCLLVSISPTGSS